jgi:hypothetical protein
MPIAPPNSTLAAVEQKVRRLTRSPSEAQLTDADLDNYINTFVVYDFPEQLRTFNLRTTFRFWCNPYQDRYITNATLPMDNVLYNFQNRYLSVIEPLYIAGYQAVYSQSRQQFFGIYPNVNSIIFTGLYGDGATTTFTGTIQLQNTQSNFVINPTINSQQTTVLLQNEVLFDSIDSTGLGIAMVDVPVIDTTSGNNTVNGNLYPPGQRPAASPTAITPGNTINYITGAFTVTFQNAAGAPSAPGAGQPINAQVVPQITSLPQAMLFYNDTFYLRPVPDQPYQINFEAYMRPTALLAENQSPQLEEWWQLISYGAALKIFQDRMDMESVQMIMPEFNSQLRLCNRRTIVQYTSDRTATIYADQASFGPGSNNGWGWGGGSF